MTAYKVHIVHVGNMGNKGTQALLKSDIHVIQDILEKPVHFSVATTDLQGVEKLDLPSAKVLPPLLDIPYEKADGLAKRYGFDRGDLKYKLFALASLFYMIVQAFFSIISITIAKFGLTPFYRTRVFKYVRDCDLVVSCSDENYKETASLLPLNLYWVLTWWSMLASRTWEILVARSLGKPVVMFPNSVGPFRTQLGKWFAQISLNMCGYLLIRDSKSYEIVDDLKIKSPRRLTWDTALLFQTEKKITLEETSHPLVGVSPGIYRSSLSKKQVQDYIHAHSKALDYLIKRYGVKVLFLPHYVTGLSYDDLEISKLIMKEMKQAKSASVMAFENVDEFKSTVDQLEMIFSSKMHPAVLAISGHVPVLCVAYDHKQTSFFNSLDLNEYVIPIRMISAEALISRFDQLWKRKTEIQNLLEKKIPVLRENVRNAIKCALQILQ